MSLLVSEQSELDPEQLLRFSDEVHKMSAAVERPTITKYTPEQWEELGLKDPKLFRKLENNYGLLLDHVELERRDDLDYIRYRFSPTIEIDEEKLEHLAEHLDYCKGATPHDFTGVWRRGYKIMIGEIDEDLDSKVGLRLAQYNLK